jgi:CheY-like chemotaxis protein
MFNRMIRNLLAAFAITMMVTFAASPASAAVNADDRGEALQWLDNFVHYTLVARPQLAESYARQLLDSGISDADLVLLLDEGRVTMERFDAAMSRAQFVPELEDIAAELAIRMEQGRMDLARDGDRIEEAVQMLIGTQRQRILAERRLREAGEYAVPELLRQVVEGRDHRIRRASETMLRQVGRLAVTPLSVAVKELGDPAAQRTVCDILGDIGYPHALPYLVELSRDGSIATPVREAANRAIRRLNVPGVGDSMPELYNWLARQYYNDAASLIAYPDEQTNNIWRYDEFIGLTPVAVRTEIFGRVMAMRKASHALGYDPNNREALSLFVAANLKRENDLPAGATDPIYGDQPYTPAFYATVFGTQTCMDVLAIALDSRDTPLVRDAIAALAKTTGGANLFAGEFGRQPLLEAMRYPDRRVQYDTALVLARALPEQSFGGDYAVVPQLASAVRTGGRLFAAIAADDEENRQVIGRRLEQLGFEIVGAAGRLDALRPLLDAATAVDLVVVRMGTADASMQMVQQLRTVPRTSVAPIMVKAEALDMPTLRLEFRGRTSIGVMRPGLDDTFFRNAIDELMDRASGGRMTEAEAEAYAIESLDALRDIAISRSSVYSIHDAERALLDALASRHGGTRLLVADILALTDSARAQVALTDAALDGDGHEQIELLNRAAQSVKRFGNRLEQRHIDGLLDLVVTSSGDTAEAAAVLHGAMNLPPINAIDLIP